MRRRTPLAIVAAGATAAALLAAPTGAGAAGNVYEMVGYSGGTLVKALGNTVTAALTAASTVEGTSFKSDSNSAASVTAAGLADVGAVDTSAVSSPIAGGVQVASRTRTAGVSLLGGLITADAIDTTAVARYSDGTLTTDTKTTFVNIKISGVTLPVTIPQNLQVTIPGVASVILNATYTVKKPDGTAVTTQSAGLYVSLLKSRGTNGIGTQVYLNPSYSAIGVTTPTSGIAVGGFAYGTKVNAAVGSSISVSSDATVPISLPGGGTSGKTISNSVATVDLGSVLNAGVVTTTTAGNIDGQVADAKTTVQVAGLNVLGLIKADAISGSVAVHRNADGSYTKNITTNFVNLVIAGQQIPVNVAPNTQINVADLGLVTINGASATANAGLVRLLTVKLSTAKLGLPVGAEVQLGVAAAYIRG